MNCRHPVVCDVVVVLPPPLDDLLPAAGSAAVLSASHKCGSGRDRTPTMHHRRMMKKKCMTFLHEQCTVMRIFILKKLPFFEKKIMNCVPHCASLPCCGISTAVEKINTGPHMK